MGYTPSIFWSYAIIQKLLALRTSLSIVPQWYLMKVITL